MWYTIAIASISERKYLHIGICFVTTQSVVWCSCHQRSATCHTSHHTVSRSNPTSAQEASAWVVVGWDHVSPVGLVIMTLGRARAHWTELLADYDPAQVEPEWSQSRARVERDSTMLIWYSRQLPGPWDTRGGAVWRIILRAHFDLAAMLSFLIW